MGKSVASRATADVCSSLLTFELRGRDSRLLGEGLASILAGPVPDAERIRALEPIAPLVRRARALLAARRPPLVRIRGLPVDSVDRTRALPHPTPLADAFLHAWACALGRQPMVYAEAREGERFQHVFPLPTTLDKPHAHGAAPIRWHIDGDHYPHDLIPDRMGLLGVLNETTVATSFAAIDTVLRALPPSTAQLLERPLYRYRPPDERGGVDKSRFTPWLPLVTRRRASATLSYMFPYVLAAPGTGAEEAIGALERASHELATRVLIERGDLVTWANGPHMHARETQVDTERGAIRWLKRVFGLRLNRHNRSALGPDHAIRATPELLARLEPRYRG